MYISDANEFKEQHKVSAIKSIDKDEMLGLNTDCRVNPEW
jgi:hypothetical protein